MNILQEQVTPRKLQISNGHYLEFDQLARLIFTINNTDAGNKVSMSILAQETGLPIRQVRNRISVGRALGIFTEKRLALTRFGILIAKHDNFFESRGTLEYLHYLAASEFRNLLWFELFNSLVLKPTPLNYKEWLEYFRAILVEQYSKHTLANHLNNEVRFLIQAYTESSLAKLEIIYQDAEDRLCTRRYLEPTPLIFAAMLYDFGARQGTNLLQMDTLLDTPGSPGRLFFLGRDMLNNTVEMLHDQGYVRYERTHNLNQIRLKEEFTSLAFLNAYYDGKKPEPQLLSKP